MITDMWKAVPEQNSVWKMLVKASIFSCSLLLVVTMKQNVEGRNNLRQQVCGNWKAVPGVEWRIGKKWKMLGKVFVCHGFLITVLTIKVNVSGPEARWRWRMECAD